MNDASDAEIIRRAVGQAIVFRRHFPPRFDRLTNANGARNQFYENMREVSPGDVVFSFCDTRIKAIGVVTAIISSTRGTSHSRVVRNSLSFLKSATSYWMPGALTPAYTSATSRESRTPTWTTTVRTYSSARFWTGEVAAAIQRGGPREQYLEASC